jgi:hypothetical protein
MEYPISQSKSRCIIFIRGTSFRTLLARQAHYSAGKPSKHDKTKLMRAEGIIRIQAGSNKFASQKGQTGMREGAITM